MWFHVLYCVCGAAWCLPFLDRDIYRRPNGFVGHKVYYKLTDTNLYLNSSSHHRPSKELAIPSKLVKRVRSLCDQDSLHVDMTFPLDIFRKNGYTNGQNDRPSTRQKA
jgi:hypothetical protein